MQQKNAHFENYRINMVKNQLMTLDIHNPQLLECFLATPRDMFVSDQNQPICYVDSNIDEACNLMLRPETLFRALDKLQIEKSDSVLVSDSGFGYVPCVVSRMGCKVLAVETDKDSLAHLTHNIATLKIRNIDVKPLNIQQKFLEEAPFNKIFINRILNADVPDLILSQLAESGRLVSIIRNQKGDEEIHMYTKIGNNDIHHEIVS